MAAHSKKASGRERMGAKRLAEDIRWDTSLAQTNSDFKMSNNITADLARLIIRLFPDELGNFFEIKQSDSRNLEYRMKYGPLLH